MIAELPTARESPAPGPCDSEGRSPVAESAVDNSISPRSYHVGCGIGRILTTAAFLGSSLIEREMEGKRIFCENIGQFDKRQCLNRTDYYRVGL